MDNNNKKFVPGNNNCDTSHQRKKAYKINNEERQKFAEQNKKAMNKARIASEEFCR